jgi:hypothetical protein
MSLTRYDTAGNILNGSAIELGLGSQADPFASPDPNWRQLVALLNHAGRDLMRRDWRQLVVTSQLVKNGTWTLPAGWSVVAGTTDDLSVPQDFRCLIDQSGWNQSTRLPLGGPLTPQLWEYRKSSPVGSIFAEFRMDTNRLRLLPTPLPNYTIQLEYQSRAWVIPAGTGLGDGNTLGPAGADAVTAASDYVLFDPELASHALKLAWKREKGFDTTTAQEDFDEDLARCLEDQISARVLGTTGPRANPHLIDIMNLPDTGFGR